MVAVALDEGEECPSRFQGTLVEYGAEEGPHVGHVASLTERPLELGGVLEVGHQIVEA